MFSAYREAAGQQKKQLKYFICGTVISFIAGGATFLPVYSIPFPFILTALMPLYPFFVGTALIRYGLFDNEQIAAAAEKDKLAAISVITASITHEIKNPLFIIHNLADTTLEDLKISTALSAEQKLEKSTRHLTSMRDQSAKAMDIMRRFMTFTKERIDQEVKLEALDFDSVLQGVLLLVSDSFRSDKIQFEKKVPGNLPKVHADRRYLEQILFNLMVNACQAMPNGGKLIVEVEVLGSSFVIKVMDTGMGIPEDIQRNIFKPFYTRKETGVGLGLHITQQLVEKCNGKISVKSRLDMGTTFMLEFSVK